MSFFYSARRRGRRYNMEDESGEGTGEDHSTPNEKSPPIRSKCLRQRSHELLLDQCLSHEKGGGGGGRGSRGEHI